MPIDSSANGSVSNTTIDAEGNSCGVRARLQWLRCPGIAAITFTTDRVNGRGLLCNAGSA